MNFTDHPRIAKRTPSRKLAAGTSALSRRIAAEKIMAKLALLEWCLKELTEDVKVIKTDLARIFSRDG